MIKSKAYGPGMPPNHCLANLARERSLSISQDTFRGDRSCDFKVFIQCEPPSVVNLIPQLILNQEAFDLILAWHPDILRYCESAVKVEFGTCSLGGGFEKKEKNEISFITSSKAFTDGHQLRQRIFNFFQTLPFKQFVNSVPSINGFTVRSRRTPPRIDSVKEMYNHAKFNICVENSRYENYFTEKLMNCFHTQTVPIYWGAPNIGEYFNEKGMIQFSDIEELKHILSYLTPDMYEYYREGMKENYDLHLRYHLYDTRIIKEIDNALKLPNSEVL